jgi:hypothetical protein
VKAAAALLLAVGCAHHFDRDDGAPGFVDLAQPPEHPAWSMTERAQAPQERLLVLTPALVGVLGLVPAGPHHQAGGALGAEVALEWSRGTTYHREIPDRDPDPVPMFGFGLAAGWMGFATSSGDGARLAPLYLEARGRPSPGITAGLGWFERPFGDGGQRGPQLTVEAGPLLLRTGYVLGEGAVAQIGVDVWGSLTWVWTR